MQRKTQRHLLDDIMQQVLREEHCTRQQPRSATNLSVQLSAGELACVQQLYGSLDTRGQVLPWTLQLPFTTPAIPPLSSQ